MKFDKTKSVSNQGYDYPAVETILGYNTANVKAYKAAGAIGVYFGNLYVLIRWI